MEKLELILPYIMTTIIFIIITVIIFRLFNFILQKRMLQHGPPDDYAIKFLKAGSESGRQSLQWAMLLSFGGLGLIILQYQPFALDSSPLPYGIEAIFLAAGFFAYYLVYQKKD